MKAISKEYSQYSKEFAPVMEFYHNASPKQICHLLNMIKDDIMIFDPSPGRVQNCYELHPEYYIDMNGTTYQLTIEEP